MIRWLIGITLLLAAFAGGVWIGWRAGDTTCAKQSAHAAQTQVQELNDAVQKRTSRRQEQLQNQQERSAAWLASKRLATIQARALSTEIVHAEFPIQTISPAPSILVGGIGSARFHRLYDAAARAGQPATAATSAHADGVHAGGL